MKNLILLIIVSAIAYSCATSKTQDEEHPVILPFYSKLNWLKNRFMKPLGRSVRSGLKETKLYHG